eukprot:TRINITY_DN624_c0_g11_i1.p1 TRINITY_DN624_c0_g11~~TRINITY_DN624_c0_g11_i1.p1  ORF type:complete len:434 (+),score=90.04 TRINITY_DN624_c0_g11_i1:243-1544(+)
MKLNWLVFLDVPSEKIVFTKGSLLNYPALWKWKLSTMVSASTVGAFILSSAAAHGSTQIATTAASFSSVSSNVVESVVSNPSMGSFILSSSLTAAVLFSGTFLQAAAANSINQVLEVELDSKMSRTRNRPLVRRLLTTSEAVVQSLLVGSLGTMILYKFASPTTAALGLANIFLYTCVYTPLKTRHWINTWVGTLNGVFPILMGASCVEQLSSLSPTTILACVALYAWQIPHFMAISFKCKADYERAGFQMLPSINASAAALQAVLHAGLLFPASIWAYHVGGLPSTALSIMLPLNYYLLFKPSLSFYSNPSPESSHLLFVDSLYHLPSFFLLLSVSPLLTSSVDAVASSTTTSLLISGVSESLKQTFSTVTGSLKNLFSFSRTATAEAVTIATTTTGPSFEFEPLSRTLTAATTTTTTTLATVIPSLQSKNL